MKSDWKKVKLREIILLKNGKSRPENGSKYPVYGGNGILGFSDLANEKSIIIIGRVGAYCGATYIENNSLWLSDNAIGIENNHLSDLKFLYYFLRSINLNKLAIGGAQPLLTQGILKDIDVNLPPLLVQQQIAQILSSLDDKIELLREENKTLEAIAQTLFKRWFVDFEFPISADLAASMGKPDLEGKLYKSSGGKMIESELGVIPEGWRVGKLGEVITLFDSKRIPISGEIRAKRKGIYPYYGATQIMDYIDNYIFEGKYLLLAEDGSVMDSNGFPVLQYVIGKFWVSNHAHVLQGKSGWSVEMLYLFFKQFNVSSIVTGAVQLKINQENLLSIRIIIPNEEILEEAVNLFKGVYQRITNNCNEITQLNNARNVLLPKLMKGDFGL